MARTLRTQLLVAPVLLTAVSFAVLGGTGYGVARSLLLDAEDRRLAGLLDQAEDLLARDARDLALKASSLADNLDLAVHLEGGPGAVPRLLPWKVRWHLDFVDLIDARGLEVLSLDAEGDRISGDRAHPRLEPEEERLFRLGMSGISFFAPVAAGDRLLLVGVAPVKSRVSGRVAGVLLLGRAVDGRVLGDVGSFLGTRLALYAPSGQRLSASAQAFDPACTSCHPHPARPTPAAFHLRFVAGTPGGHPSFTVPAQRVGVRQVSVGGEPLGLLAVERDLTRGAAALARGVTLLGGLAAVSALGGLAALGLALRRIVRPLANLASATARRAGGDLGGEVPAEGAREVRELARAFNTMSERLRESLAGQAHLMGEMEARVEERTRALEEAVEKLLTVNDLGRRLPRSADGPALLRAAVPLVAQAVGARAAFALVREEARGGWRVEGVYGRLAPRSLEVSFPPELPVPSLLLPGEGLLLEGTRDAPLADPVSGKAVRALLAAPLGDATGAGAPPRGVLLLYDPDGRASFTRRDMDVVLPFAREVASALAVAHLHGQAHRAALGIIQTLVNAVEAKDPYTKGHTLRVTQIATRLGHRLGLADDRIEALRQAATLHDIGKIGVRHDVLNKPEGLTAVEYDLVKQHPLIGSRILEPLVFLQDAGQIVLQHHERPDGTGYPLGVPGDRLLLESRILAAADAFDAMTSQRPYSQALSPAKALGEMRLKAGSQFDPAVVDALEAVL